MAKSITKPDGEPDPKHVRQEHQGSEPHAGTKLRKDTKTHEKEEADHDDGVETARHTNGQFLRTATTAVSHVLHDLTDVDRVIAAGAVGSCGFRVCRITALDGGWRLVGIGVLQRTGIGDWYPVTQRLL